MAERIVELVNILKNTRVDDVEDLSRKVGKYLYDNIRRIGDIVLTIVGAIFMLVGFINEDMMLVAVGIVWAIVLPDWDE